jgi:uncharacterized protein (UPF0179 family)
MPEITLLATPQAKVGFEFVYMGGAPVCRTCPYRHACLTLDSGRRYRVSKVRPVQHPCALQEATASVVEVAPVPRPLVVDPRSAIAGASVEVSRYACARMDCPNYEACATPSLPSKQRFRVERVEDEPAECRIGRPLRRVEAV